MEPPQRPKELRWLLFEAGSLRVEEPAAEVAGESSRMEEEAEGKMMVDWRLRDWDADAAAGEREEREREEGGEKSSVRYTHTHTHTRMRTGRQRKGKERKVGGSTFYSQAPWDETHAWGDDAGPWSCQAGWMGMSW